MEQVNTLQSRLTRHQLLVMMRNHQHIISIKKRCAKAKEELSYNLYTRLKWVMYIQVGYYYCIIDEVKTSTCLSFSTNHFKVQVGLTCYIEGGPQGTEGVYR